MISADSGMAPASGALAAHDAPEWCSRWAGIGAHVRPESLLTIDRNGCSRCAGIRNVRDRALPQCSQKILCSEIGFVCTYFFHRESALCGLIDQWFEVWVIVRVSVAHFD